MPSKLLDALEEQVGWTVTTVEDLVVEPGKVEEFARAIEDDNPAFRDEEAARKQGYETVPAPLTFTRTAYFPRNRPTASASITDSTSGSTSLESSTANRSTSTSDRSTPGRSLR
ncbi:FAS1-like dehydratase domain-containing protein [Natrinema soli]|uniref:MaoC family dehydratase N-terminal domain-containing protein n=1 Tax=Natrinema soli TaxID=1930624 RepID=A0ABD5SJS0_9EURY